MTSRTWESRKLFVIEATCEIFVRVLADYRERGEFGLHGFVLMPDHFHVLLTPGADKTLERCVQMIKGGSAHAIREEQMMKFPVWQRGFSDHRIRDAADFDGHVRYMQMNPIKARLVSDPREYRWSSGSGSVALDEGPQGLKPRVSAAAVRHG